MNEFKLSDSFLDQYKGKQPSWGPIGYITYKRTYARRIEEEGRTEEFWETLKRVVEGCFSIQKKHCVGLGLPWKTAEAQKSAQKMYEKMWNFKFLPPGRSLWIAGTEFIDKHGSASLQNCAFVSTHDIDIRGTKCFEFAMDMLMLGVGVGFDTKGAGQVTIKYPKNYGKGERFKVQIPDSREGWVEALRTLLLSFFEGKIFPEFDYSLIRPAGTPIKGFGGVASGPQSLMEMLNDIGEILLNRVGEKITSSNIVDIFNNIAKCVVAGNVRRSAMLALGDPDDKEYIELKDPIKNKKELESHRWASNNSIEATVGMDYSTIVDGIKKNGEPGIIWLENAQNYSRMNNGPDYKDIGVLGFNPCFSKETLIAVADGRGAVPIEQLANEGMDVPVYSVNPDGMIEIKWGRNPRITGYNQDLLEITLDDDSILRVTPNHKMLLINGEEIEAKDLKKGDSLKRFNKKIEKFAKDGNDYLRISRNTLDMMDNRVMEHRMIADFFQKEKFEHMYDESKKSGWTKGGIVIHHKDYNGLNNSPENLEIMTFKDHCQYHSSLDRTGEENGMFGKNHTDKTKKLISEKSKERYKNPEYKSIMSKKIKESSTEEVRKKISKSRKEDWEEYYKEFEKNTDLKTIWIDKHLYVVKNCETCGKEMILNVRQRETSFCSKSCHNKNKDFTKKRIAGQKIVFKEKQRQTIHDQIMVYKDLQEQLGRDPLKKEWEIECLKRHISYRISKKSTNEFVLKSYEDLKERVPLYNHRVKSIKAVDGKHTVYNITVDNNHTVAIVTKFNKENLSCDGVLTLQCGEQTLESYEMCNLIETYPSRHESYEEFEETLKYAYMYAKTITLLNTHWKETNAVMLKNRRIGLSQTGIIDAFAKHGRREILNWCKQGYDFLRKKDKQYSDWLCIPQSIKMTTVKPSGTISLLPGVSPGIHYPHSKYYIRRMRIADNSYLLDILKDAGYEIEPDVVSKNTMVVSFPIEEKYFIKSKKDASIWEQMENAAAYQKFWSDNAVSVTVTFRKDEENSIKDVLEHFEDRLKGVSFLPLKEHGYKQPPYEEITKEKYEEMASKIKPMDLSAHNEKALGEKYCSNDGCAF